MAFGFDPSIIMAGIQRQPSAVDTMRSLSDLFQGRQMHQASLASLLQRQQQEQMLAPYRLENEQAQTEAYRARAESAFQDSMRQRAEILGRPFRDVQDQAGVDAAFEALRQAGVPDSALGSIPRQFSEQTAPVYKALAKMGAPMGRQLSPAEEEARLARADFERAKTEDIRKGPKPQDPAKARNLQLRNEKLERDLGKADAGGEAPVKESDVRSWSSQVPDGTRNIFSEVSKAKAIADEVGGLDKLAGVGLVGGKAPPQLLGAKDQKFRQHAAAAANAYRKIFAGAAVSEQEGAQLNKAIAMVESGKTANEVATGLMILEGFADDGLEQALAGASPRIKARIVKDIKPSAKKAAPKAGNVVPAKGSGLTAEQRRAEIEALRMELGE